MLKPKELMQKPILALCIFLALLGAAYLALQLMFNKSPFAGFDFRVVWLAGQVWNDGGNPYDFEAWDRLYKEAPFFPKMAILHGFYYTPSMAPICRIIALLDFHTAVLLWRFISAVLWVVVLIVTIRYLQTWQKDIYQNPLFWLALFFCFVSNSLAITLSIGQSPILSTVGLLMAFVWI